MIVYIIMALIAYAIGSISFSIIISKKMAGFDVRETSPYQTKCFASVNR